MHCLIKKCIKQDDFAYFLIKEYIKQDGFALPLVKGCIKPIIIKKDVGEEH